MSEIIVVKIGGVAGDNLTDAFFSQIEKWQADGKRIVLVHGGGHYINEMMGRLNIPVTIRDGLRVTTEAALEITRMVLIGHVQPMITTRLQQKGFPVVGLNASNHHLLVGEFKQKEQLGYVGEPQKVNTQLLEDLLENHYIPVIAPLGMTLSGQWLNINADQAACKIAEELAAESLYLLTDVPGIKKNEEWLKEVAVSDIEKMKKNNVVSGGMIPKLDSAAWAVKSGVQTVHITDAIHHQGTMIKHCGVSA